MLSDITNGGHFIMSGQFRYRNSGLFAAGIAAFFILIPITSRLGSEPWIPMSVLAVICLFVVIRAVNFTCRYATDD